MKLLILLICVFPSTILSNKIFSTESALLSRQKRTLIWHEGVNWVQMIVGVGIPTELHDQSITMGSVIKAFYLLPTNSSSYTHPSIDYARKKRSATRWIIYEMLETFLERNGYGDGKACMLKHICEASMNPFEEKSGIFAEILHVLLTPSSTDETLDSHLNSEYHAAEKLGQEADNCHTLFPECTGNFLQQFSRFYQEFL